MTVTQARTGLVIPNSSGSDPFTELKDGIRAAGLWIEANSLIFLTPGLLSALPAAGTVGRIYKATDVTGALYYDNGTGWESVGVTPPTDAAAGVGSLRTLGAGSLQAAPGNHTHGVSGIVATGTPSATTFLRGDGTWATVGGTIGYDLYAWTPSADDAYPVVVTSGGTAITFTAAAGRPCVGPAATGANEVVGRANLMRVPGSATSPGTIKFSGAVRYTGATTDSVVAFGMSSNLTAGNWAEGIALQVLAASGSAKVWSRTGSGFSPSDYTAGTQRGSTVTGLSAGTWYPVSFEVSAAGNLIAIFNGSTVFTGASGVDMVETTGQTPSWAVQCTTAANLSVSTCAVTYS